MKKILMAALAVLLTACSQMESGIVVSKMYHPESGYWSSMCVSYGQYGCTMSMPVYNTIPQSWEFALRDGDDTGYRDVTEQEYHEYKVGDRYP